MPIHPRPTTPPPSANWREADWPAVSVSVITYNQRDLLPRALDSILAQRTNFRFEIIIGDDGSTDGTQDVIRDYHRRYPDIIVPILHPRNNPDAVAGRTNNLTNLAACRGRYTAMLDGDDYWSCPDKLQFQYDILEKYPEVNLSVHDTEVLMMTPDGREDRWTLRWGSPRQRAAPGILEGWELFERYEVWFHVSSVFFRTRVFEYFPEALWQVISADNFIIMLAARNSRIHYDATIRSVYLKHGRNFTNTDGYQDVMFNRAGLRNIQIFQDYFPELRRSKVYQERYRIMRLQIGRRLLVRHKAPLAAVRQMSAGFFWLLFHRPQRLADLFFSFLKHRKPLTVFPAKPSRPAQIAPQYPDS